MPKEAVVNHEVVARSVDDALAHHLKQAEEHLIEAVKLFAKKRHPDRRVDYIDKLTRAQEMVTSLLREELVRVRGPVKVRLK